MDRGRRATGEKLVLLGYREKQKNKNNNNNNIYLLPYFFIYVLHGAESFRS
jgi:hypothetical protein